jgi:hypothetical protein
VRGIPRYRDWARGMDGEPMSALPLWLHIPYKVAMGSSALYMIFEGIRGLIAGEQFFLGASVPGEPRLVGILTVLAGLLVLVYAILGLKRGPVDPGEML